MKITPALAVLAIALSGCGGSALQRQADADCRKLGDYVAVGVDAQSPHGSACRPTTQKQFDADAAVAEKTDTSYKMLGYCVNDAAAIPNLIAAEILKGLGLKTTVQQTR